MGRRLINRQYKLGSRAPSMQTLTGDSGIANLSPYLTINGSTVAPTFVYRGGDADSVAGEWPAYWGETLSETGSGNAIKYDSPSYGNGPSDKAVGFDGGVIQQSSSTTFGNLDTVDCVIELAMVPRSSNKYILSKFDTTPSEGWRIRNNSATNICYANIDASSNINIPIVKWQVQLLHFFFDRDGNATGYGNAVAGTPVDISSFSSDQSNAIAMSLGGGNSYSGSDDIIYAAMWQGASMIGTDNAAVALERFQKWSGIYPTKASGTAAPTYSRDCSAYATKWNGTSYDLINCSAGLPRVDYVLDDSGTPFKGMLIEPQGTNLLPYSNDIDNAAWVKSGCTIGASTGVTTPAQSIDYQSIIVDSGTISNPNIADSIACTSDNYSYSAIVRAGSSGFCFLRQYAGATGGSKVYFNLTTGAVASSSGTQVVDSNIESLGGGDYLISAVFTCTSGANLVQVYTADTDGGSAVVGDGSTVNTYVGFIQAELGNKPTSRIYTAGASATRLADSLQYNGDNVTAGQGTFKAEFLMGNYDSAASTWIVDIHNSSTANTYIDAYCNTSDVSNFRGRISGVTQWWIAGSDVVTDGNKHDIRGIWESNNAKQYIDGAIDGTPDTSGTVPTGLDEIYVGQNDSSANQLNGRIRNFRIYGFASSDV